MLPAFFFPFPLSLLHVLGTGHFVITWPFWVGLHKQIAPLWLPLSEHKGVQQRGKFPPWKSQGLASPEAASGPGELSYCLWWAQPHVVPPVPPLSMQDKATPAAVGCLMQCGLSRHHAHTTHLCN